jgi:DNA-binding transcriptional MerR regulator
MSNASVQSGGDGGGWTVDELALRASLPVRTIREYQTIGLLPGPRREGRVGRYGAGHLQRLALIARLRRRGYSLAGIGDLLGSWSAGADLGEVLGLEPDQLVHVDEPGAPASLDQLRKVLPSLIPEHLGALEVTGAIERCGPDSWCVPSPSLVQLAIDADGIGLAPEEIIELLGAIGSAADLVARAAVHQIHQLVTHRAPDDTDAFLRRGRGLLAHGVGRLTLHRIGQKLDIRHEADLLGARHPHLPPKDQPT